MKAKRKKPLSAAHLVVAVDPGTRSAGWASALCTGGRLEPRAGDRVRGGLIKARSSWRTWPERAMGMARSLFEESGLLSWSGEAIVVCEYPEFRSGAVGEMAARSGDTLLLAYQCGLLGGMCDFDRVEFRPAPVSAWKGQLSKAETWRRTLEAWARAKVVGKISLAKADTRDALGLLAWAVGRLD